MPELQYMTEMRMLFPTLFLSASVVTPNFWYMRMFRFSLLNRQAKMSQRLTLDLDANAHSPLILHLKVMLMVFQGTTE